MRLIVSIACAGVALLASPSSGSEPGTGITGSAVTYTVVGGDTLRTIASRFGVYPSTIAADNHIDLRRPLEAGRRLRIDNEHIVPELVASGEIVVNVPQRMVFYQDGDRVVAYPIAVGRPTWQTPVSTFSVVSMDEDPAWHVPASIRAESERKGRTLPPVVPPGPKNPLGRRWIGLSVGGVGIHGTPSPSSIYQAATHGCVRLHPDDVADLFEHVAIGTPGSIVYEPILMAATGDAVFIEVHPDIYRRFPESAHQQARELAARLGLLQRIDWTIADREIERRAGVARRVSR